MKSGLGSISVSKPGWPDNRRKLYNRASADPEGKSWSESKTLVWWEEVGGHWQSYDEVDFGPEKRPDYRPDRSAVPVGMAAIHGEAPFIMIPDGRSHLFTSSGLKDGPLPSITSRSKPGRKRALSPADEPGRQAVGLGGKSTAQRRRSAISPCVPTRSLRRQGYLAERVPVSTGRGTGGSGRWRGDPQSSATGRNLDVTASFRIEPHASIFSSHA